MLFKKLVQRLKHLKDSAPRSFQQLEDELFIKTMALEKAEEKLALAMATIAEFQKLNTKQHMELTWWRLLKADSVAVYEEFTTHGGKPHANVDLPQFLRKRHDGEEGQQMAKQTP